MSPNLNLGGWIHIFTVTDTQTHKGGYTIYKITSVVFPRSVPQALTCLTVWKRFHDVKRLHRELARRHRNLQLSGQLPEPTDCSFFKRFDADVIRRRKAYILQLLDFAAQHPVLYKCHAFAQFFSDAQHLVGGQCTPTVSPLHELHLLGTGKGSGGSGAIAEICDNLDLRYDPHDAGPTLCEPACDKRVELPDNVEHEGAIDTLEEKEKEVEVQQREVELQTALVDPTRKCKDYTRFLTPMASIESDDSDYIYEAALKFSHAVQAEANLEYQEAYVRYKCGVELLLNGSKDDGNDERKFIAKTKISKYLARADDIYDRFLRVDASERCANGKSNFQLSIDVADSSGDASALYLERPWNHLAKYKVVKVLGGSVMQVQSITEPQRPTYVMKGIEKPSSNSSGQSIFLPQHVPYMVDLLAFFQSEQKIFLLLKQAEGGRLYKYIQTYTADSADRPSADFATLFPEVKETVVAEESCLHVPVVNFNKPDVPESTTQTTPTVATEFSELVRCSQQLLQSVSNTLKVAKQMEEIPEQQQPVEAPESIQAVDSLQATTNHTATATRIPEACLKQWARELAVAVHCLHGKGVILSDLHMDNLLLGAKGQLLLTYFYQHEGLASMDNYVHKAYNPQALAAHFVAPERPLSCKSDWWSYGVILYQLLLGVPFEIIHPGRIDLYGCVQYPEDVAISENAQDLLEHLLQPASDERFGYAEIQAHSFFAGTNWEEVRQNGFNSVTTIAAKPATVSN